MYIIGVYNKQCFIGYIARKPNSSHIIVATHDFIKAIHYDSINAAVDDLFNVPPCYSYRIIKIQDFEV